MPVTQLKKQLLLIQSPIELEEPYSLDTWPIKEWPLYKNARNEDRHYYDMHGYKGGTFDFSSIETLLVKDEIKFFLYHSISYYKFQLQELEATLGAAKATENETLIKKTEEDIIAVERIITEVERLCNKETQKD